MKLMIVDDDSLVRQSLLHLLSKEEDIKVISTAENGEQAIELCRQETPDIILMDIQMPVMDGIESTRILKNEYPFIHIMMLTTFQDEHNIRLALQAGAKGYLLKSTAIESMTAQIRACWSGATVLDADVLKTIIEPASEALEGLTEREADIVQFIAQGFSNREIGKQLYLSEGTVRNMLSVILDKLELRDRTQLAIYYWQRKRHE